jgi:hypothetical protein
MFDLPNKEKVEKCIVIGDVITKGSEPIYLESDRKSA